jgi:hypothetical protein
MVKLLKDGGFLEQQKNPARCETARDFGYSKMDAENFAPSDNSVQQRITDRQQKSCHVLRSLWMGHTGTPVWHEIFRKYI